MLHHGCFLLAKSTKSLSLSWARSHVIISDLVPDSNNIWLYQSDIFSLSVLYLYLSFKVCLLYFSTMLSWPFSRSSCLLASGRGRGQKFSAALPSLLCPGSQGYPWLALTSRIWRKWCHVNSEPESSHVPSSRREPSSHCVSNLARLMKDERPCGERPRHVDTSTGLVLLEEVPDTKGGPAEDSWAWPGLGRLPSEVALTCCAK